MKEWSEGKEEGMEEKEEGEGDGGGGGVGGNCKGVLRDAASNLHCLRKSNCVDR